MSGFPVLIMRAEPGAQETATRLEALGYSPILCPVLQLRRDPEVRLPDLSGFSGIAFTSANGVRFFAEVSDARSLPVWCVGPATAEAARDAGFEMVWESAGNAVDLADFIAANHQGEGRAILHVANAAAKGDFARQLSKRGFQPHFVPLYRADPVETLTLEALKLIASGQSAGLLVHSAKGAAAFVHLAADLSCADLIGVAISDQAAAPLKRLELSGIHIASAPNEAALMQALAGAKAPL